MSYHPGDQSVWFGSDDVPPLKDSLSEGLALVVVVVGGLGRGPGWGADRWSEVLLGASFVSGMPGCGAGWQKMSTCGLSITGAAGCFVDTHPMGAPGLCQNVVTLASVAPWWAAGVPHCCLGLLVLSEGCPPRVGV